MCRTVTLLVALAAFAVASAFGTPASSSKSRRRASVGHAHHPRAGAEASRRVNAHATAKNTSRTSHRPTPDEVGRAAGLRIRRDMARGAVYRRRRGRAEGRRLESRAVRYRRARLIETARVSRYHAGRYDGDRPEPTPVASYENERPQAVDAPSAQTLSPDSLKQAEERQYGAGQRYGENVPSAAAAVDDVAGRTPAYDEPAAAAQRSGERLERSSRVEGIREAPPAIGRVLPEAAVEGSNDLADNDSADNAAGEAAPEPAAGVRSESDVASLTIPHGAMPAPLRGSLASLERQNDRLTAEGLERIENEDDLAARIANHLLVPVPASDALVVNPALPPNHRYCRPWTARFVADLAREHEALFHRPLEVSSAVRTVEYQRHLMRINGNAAPAEGDIVSPHLTGATIDIAKEGLTRAEIDWMRRRLLQLEEEGKIDVEEEFQQACFHITVYTTYAPPRPARRAVHEHPENSQPSAPAESADGSDTEGL